MLREKRQTPSTNTWNQYPWIENRTVSSIFLCTWSEQQMKPEMQNFVGTDFKREMDLILNLQKENIFTLLTAKRKHIQ